MKAQVNQAFIYIFVLIIIAGIVLIAFRFVGTTVDKGCEVETLTFKENLENFADRYSDYGTLNEEKMLRPCSYDLLCIINPEVTEEDNVASPSLHPFIADSFEIKQFYEGNVGDERQVNVFLAEGTEITPLGRLENINAGVGFCVEATAGRFELQFEGFGKTTKISQG
jgi:hypothetical protein